MSPQLRHPAARAVRGDLLGVASRLSDGLRRLGVRHPELAAAVLVVRGGEGRSPEGFAAEHGMAPETVTALEAGEAGIEAVPAPLLQLTPLGRIHRELVGQSRPTACSRAHR